MSDEETVADRQMLQETVRKLMERHASPETVRRLDREQQYPEALYREWATTGLFGLPFPEELGGAGYGPLDLCTVVEEIARFSADFVMAFNSTIFCGLNLQKHGTEEQQCHWLPLLLSGERKFSIAISEPDAGSDVGAIRATAVRDGTDWIINGHKLWTTGAGAPNSTINVYVRTDPDTKYRDALSLFLVDNDTPGVSWRKLDMLGRRCVGTYEVEFDSVRVPHERLVGGVNKGWQVVMSGLQIERVVAAANNVGAAQGALDLAVEYSKERKQFGQAIGTFQALAHQLADLSTDVEAARALTWRAAEKLSRGEDALREISMAKLFSSETFVRVASAGMQILGAYGYSMEFDMQRWFRDSRAATIAAGTSQMQRNLIANLIGLKVR